MLKPCPLTANEENESQVRFQYEVTAKKKLYQANKKAEEQTQG